MQSWLSLEQTPPISVPLRFFLTAPLWGLLGAGLMLWGGLAQQGILNQRWSDVVLAVTHCFTAGWMLQVMVGACLQILPVVVGAHVRQVSRVALWIHLLITLGALALVAHFLFPEKSLVLIALVGLGGGGALFLMAVADALQRAPAATPLVRAFKLALTGLSLTLMLGVVLLWGRHAGMPWLSLSLTTLTDVHAAWGLIGWAVILLMGFAPIAIPMFQITPAYPKVMERFLPLSLTLLLVVWTGQKLLESDSGWGEGAITSLLSLVCSGFALQTLWLQYHSRRPNPDPAQIFWWIGMLSLLSLGGLLGLRQPLGLSWEGWDRWIGTLILFGLFLSVMTGMLYKILPFLAWLHLQQLGQGRLIPPTMNSLLEARRMRWQLFSHGAGLSALLMATLWPVLDPLAALLLGISQCLLLANLVLAWRRFQIKRIEFVAALKSQAI